MKDTTEIHIGKGELLNKRIVLYTLCGIATLFAVTVCSMAMRAMSIPDSIDRLATFVLGNLTGILTMTGVNRMPGANGDPLPVTNAEGEPLQVEAVSEDEPQANSQPAPSALSKAVRK